MLLIEQFLILLWLPEQVFGLEAHRARVYLEILVMASISPLETSPESILHICLARRLVRYKTNRTFCFPFPTNSTAIHNMPVRSLPRILHISRGSKPTLVACATPRYMHATARRAKNPYYFYDVMAKQPRTSFDPSQFSFNNGHLSTEDRVKLVFGQLGSRQDRRLEAQKHSLSIAGLKLGARPEEPNNCCMSGCIDCVWELYKEELQEWKAKRKEIKKKLMLERTDLEWPEAVLGPEPKERRAARPEDKAKMSDEFAQLEDDDADDDLNVSIREFLKTEKRLKEKRKKLQLQQQQQQQQQPQQQAAA